MDLNLLAVLDALLQENSVTKAADRLATSPAAVSRKLATLRRAVGDPLLVRAGQEMTPTPRALELRPEVRALVEHAQAVLHPTHTPDIATLRRTFTVQTGDLLQAALSAPLIAAVRAQAPGVDIVFLPESLEDTGALRHGSVDVELGVLGHLDPETRTEPVAAIPLLGVARRDHPLFAAPMTVRRFAAAEHIGISRTGKRRGPIDTALARKGLSRHIAAVVPHHLSALLLARETDLVALTIAGPLADTVTALGLRTFPLPVATPRLPIALAWHPRHDADHAHQWFRGHLRTTARRLADPEAP